MEVFLEKIQELKNGSRGLMKLYKSRPGYLELHREVAGPQNPQEHRMQTHGHVWWSRAMWPWNHAAAGRVALLWSNLIPPGSSIYPLLISGIGPQACDHTGKGRMDTSRHTYPGLAEVAIAPAVLDEVGFFDVLWRWSGDEPWLPLKMGIQWILPCQFGTSAPPANVKVVE